MKPEPSRHLPSGKVPHVVQTRYHTVAFKLPCNGYTSFGSDVTTPGYVTESATSASCGSDGSCLYTFKHTVPAKATGSVRLRKESLNFWRVLSGAAS